MIDKLLLGAVRKKLPAPLRPFLSSAMSKSGQYSHDLDGIRSALRDHNATAQQLTGMLDQLNNPVIRGIVDGFAPGFVDFVNEESQALITGNNSAPTRQQRRQVERKNTRAADRLARLR